MDTVVVTQQAVKFNRARNNLLGMAALTAINLFLIVFNSNINFAFSAFTPQLLLIALQDFLGLFLGLIVALAGTAVFLVCYILSKRNRVLMLVALILFVLDALIMLGILWLAQDFSGAIWNIAFHAWILFYLITGTVAWAKLRHVRPDYVQAIQADAAQAAQAVEQNAALHTIAAATQADSTPHWDNGQMPFTAPPMEDVGMYALDDFIKNRIHASYTPIEKLYPFWEIPPQKLENARRSYAQALGADEAIIFLYDDTVKHSANDGFMLTTKRLYSKNFGMQGQITHISNMNRMTVPKFGHFSSNIHIHLNTGEHMEIHITRKAEEAEAIYGMLDRTVALLRNEARRV